MEINERIRKLSKLIDSECAEIYASMKSEAKTYGELERRIMFTRFLKELKDVNDRNLCAMIDKLQDMLQRDLRELGITTITKE